MLSGTAPPRTPTRTGTHAHRHRHAHERTPTRTGTHVRTRTYARLRAQVSARVHGARMHGAPLPPHRSTRTAKKKSATNTARSLCVKC